MTPNVPGGHPGGSGGHPGGDGAPRSHGGHPGGHPGGPPPVGTVRANGYRYDRAPMLVYWETTVACGLVCRHCRASATTEPGPLQLTTEEGYRLLDEVVRFGEPNPHVVFTGGDPLRRRDLLDLVTAATARGIGSSLAPAATPELQPEVLERLRDAGIQTMSLSIDGSDAERHDGFRGVPGTFEATVRAAGWAHDLGIPLQINTLVTDETLPDLPAIYDLMGELDILRWSLFFLISVGRGTALREISPAESEKLNHWLYERSKVAPFAIKTTEATHYRRVAMRAMEADGMDAATIARSSVGRGFGIRDGNGIMFISQDGDVYPSGFLPLVVGNVRESSIVDLYRDHEVFRRLRDVSAFKGRCGRCPYAETCGGSRARAYAWTGDELEADPLCPYVPSAGDETSDIATPFAALA